MYGVPVHSPIISAWGAEEEDFEFEVYSYNINEIDASGIAKTERALGLKPIC